MPKRQHGHYVGLAVYDYCNMYCTSNTVDGRWNAWVDPIPGNDQDNGLIHQYNLAQAHGKPIAFTEWGLWPASRSPGGGDTPSFVQRFAQWRKDHSAAYEIYNDVGDHLLDNYPNAKAEYKTQFGS